MNSTFLFRRYSIFLIALVVSYLQSVGQDSTSVKIDSLTAAVIQYTPYYSQTGVSAGTYVKVVTDSNLLRFSAGASVFNVLRGQVPGCYTWGAPANGGGAFRSSVLSSNTNVVIDGVAYSQDFLQYFNFNAFEFSEIGVLPMNAMLLFGSSDLDRAITLTTKSGRNVFKPTLEFNTYHTQIQDGQPASAFGPGVKEPKWYLSSALSYMQDYGKLDLRVSYNFSQEPQLILQPNQPYSPRYHNFKINTGFEVGDKFSVRLISDARFHSYSWSAIRPQPQPDTTDHTGNKNFLQANIIVKYSPFKWLDLTSQLVQSQRDSAFTRLIKPAATFTERDKADLQQMGNLFATANKTFGNFSLKGVVGYQLHKLKIRQTPEDFFERWPRTNSFLLTGLTTGYKNIAYVNLSYKNSHYSYEQNMESGNYGASAAVILTQLFTVKGLDFGKIRGGWKLASYVPFLSYPHEVNLQAGFIPATSRNNQMELGFDLHTLKSKLQWSTTYYRNTSQLSEGPSVNYAKSVSRGWEVDVKYIMQNSRINYNSSIMMSRFDSKYTDRFNPTIGSEEFSTPEVRMGWGNLIVKNRVSLNLLLEIFRADFSYLFGGSKTSTIKFRDMAVGFDLLDKAGYGIVRSLNLSIVARNLIILESTGFDADGFPEFQKSISLGLSARF
ncbi:MAG: hypothetical protein J0L67_17090 [Cytophagales bacterium]|nr:hypothetical protein [Cytophagales bacterium]